MKIILDVPVGTHEDIESAQKYVDAVKRTIERKHWQGFEGALLEFGGECILIKSITLDGAI